MIKYEQTIYGDPADVEKSKLVADAIKAKHNGDNKLERNLWLQVSRLQLKDQYGVENLTTIEGVHLRRITEEVIKEQLEQETRRESLAKSGDMDGAMLVDSAMYDSLDKEIIDRWLKELYDITRKDIPGKINDDAFKEYLRRLRENAHQI